MTCPFCREPVLLEELDGVRARELADGKHVHSECLMRSIIGSLGHQLGRCSCYGGTEEDPPGLTKRQAARAAWDYFLHRGPERN